MISIVLNLKAGIGIDAAVVLLVKDDVFAGETYH